VSIVDVGNEGFLEENWDKAIKRAETAEAKVKLLEATIERLEKQLEEAKSTVERIDPYIKKLEESCYYYEGIIEDSKPTVTRGDLVEALREVTDHLGTLSRLGRIYGDLTTTKSRMHKARDLIARAKGEG
jgi:hypothetical protein